MATVVCTTRLENIGPCEPANYAGDTVSDVLNSMAADYPRLNNYLLDDQGRVRKHVAIFVDGELVPREHVLSASVLPQSEIYLMQALSGG